MGLSKTGRSPGTQTGFEEIYYRQVDTVFRVCYSFMKSRAEAEDMVQETFLRLLARAPAFENERHEKAWLIVTASNLCRDSLRKWWRDTEDLADHPELGARDTLENPVLEAVRSLPESYRVPVYLHYYEGWQTAEIAARLGIPHATVRTRLARARKKLKSILGGDL